MRCHGPSKLVGVLPDVDDGPQPLAELKDMLSTEATVHIHIYDVGPEYFKI